MKKKRVVRLALILILLFSPLGWNRNYLYSLLAVMLTPSVWRHFPPAGQIILVINFVVIGTSLIEIWGRELFRFYTHDALVAVSFLIVLVSLIFLRAKNSV